ncbi:MAG: hypothetical protein Q4C79_05160 [Neisseria sp.]|uniref:hypothetical protein n=1 Tax=Neisseria sp. TaxID=192066 RepID=UPI0026DB7C13|nr:hypothetical protein [Neisseria sp.]MDO4248339.1 hypothetical protein [Neisseria sp.]
MKKFSQLSLIFASLLLGWSAQVAAGQIYECNGIYTDKPSASCRSGGAADLPPIGRYSSAPVERVRSSVQLTDSSNSPSKSQGNSVRRAVANAAAPAKQNVRPASYTTPAVPTAAPAAVPSNAKPSGSNGRRMILEQELKNERLALAAAQAELIRARAVKNGSSVDANRVTGLQGSVHDRQQNIQALQRELARL